MLATRPHKQGECNLNVCPQIRGVQAGGKPLTSHDAASQALTCPSTAELGKFCRSFDDVFGSHGAEVVLTPVQAPKANAYAERWVRTECLDWLLIVGRGHLEYVLRVYVEHYNRHRSHRALRLQAPDRPAGLTLTGADHPRSVHRRDLLGGLVHEYRTAA
jgi:transposase InsO family protein